jgi:hypothetical protein
LPNDSNGDDGLIDMDSFYASFGVFYIIVVLTIAALLCINPHWRRRWFYFIEECIDTCYCFLAINFRKLSRCRRWLGLIMSVWAAFWICCNPLWRCSRIPNQGLLTACLAICLWEVFCRSVWFLLLSLSVLTWLVFVLVLVSIFVCYVLIMCVLLLDLENEQPPNISWLLLITISLIIWNLFTIVIVYSIVFSQLKKIIDRTKGSYQHLRSRTANTLSYYYIPNNMWRKYTLIFL